MTSARDDSRHSGTSTGSPSSSGSGRSRKYRVVITAMSWIVNGLRMPVDTFIVRIVPSSGGCAAAAMQAFATKSTGIRSIRIDWLAAKRPGIRPAP